ncbi:hypothetical protein D5086_021953 [Populus alba]|uniref:Uncharacterized protein n=1 Tax=Populus alba TaxID=43335 RepID=A0ACC4BEC3_POPAL
MATSQSQTLATLTPIQLLPGYRFNPYDEELVRFFLIHGEDVFFFTDLKRKSPNSNVSRKIAGGPATWHREDKDHQVCVQIDKNYSVTALKKGFSYRNTQPHQPGCSWMMYEYSLPSLSQVTVLCQLRRKDDDNSHQSTQKNKKRKRADADDVDDAANIISQKARVDQHDQQQHNMGFYRASETVSEEVVNGVRFKDFESFYRQNVQDFDSCEMVANSTTSTTGHVSPTTVSTLNPDENFKPFEADVVPAIEAAPVQVDGVQATQVGSILIESFTSEVVENHPDSEVSDDSSLWIESFPPAFAQANPTCGLIQENKIQMIPNPFFMDCFY